MVLALPVGCAIEDRVIDVNQNLPDDAGPTPDSMAECVSGSTGCVTSTQRRVCVLGRWSEAESCSNACVGDDCGGVCVPGAQQCASGSQVQRCSDRGEWGAPTACPSSCSGDGCVGECTAGTSDCFSASQLRLCNERGQWQTPNTCQFACQGSACAGECTPGALRCGAAESDDSVDPCEAACTSLASDPLNCGSCGHGCLGGACVAGQCQPVVLGAGFTSPSAVALSATHLYFTEGAQGAGRVVRVPKAGGVLETVAQGVSNLVGVAIGGEQLYYASGNAATLGQGQVLRADLDGGSLLAFSPLRAPGIFSLIVAGLDVYYTERNAMSTLIYRAGLLSQGQAGAGAEVELETLSGVLASTTVNGGCMFYVAQGAPNRIMRKCNPADIAEVHYTGGAGEVTFQPAAGSDADYLYFAQGTTLSRIALEPPAGSEALVGGRVSAPSVDADALYYAARLDDTAGGCSSEYSLLRASKAPGAGTPSLLLAPPLACPSALALDDTAVYWISDDGSALLKLAK